MTVYVCQGISLAVAFIVVMFVTVFETMIVIVIMIARNCYSDWIWELDWLFNFSL